MHMILFGGAVHVIALAVLAFFVLFAASKASGFVKMLGNVLGYLLLVLAVLVLMCRVLVVVGVFPHGTLPADHMHWMMKGTPSAQQLPAPKK